MLFVHQLTKRLQNRIAEDSKSNKVNLPNDAIKGPMARASACKLLNIPKIVPFSLSKPFVGIIIRIIEKNND
jgi:hypothetical protein